MRTGVSRIEDLEGRATIDIASAAHLIGISKQSAYVAVRAGELPSLKIGGRIVVPVVPLKKLLGLDSDGPTQEAA